MVLSTYCTYSFTWPFLFCKRALSSVASSFYYFLPASHYFCGHKNKLAKKTEGG